MSTKDALEGALKEALKAGDDLRKRTLRMALSAIRFAEIDKGQELEESQVQLILQKEIKTRQEAIAEAQHAGRPELEAAARDEIAVLQAYLPQQLSQAELEDLARQVIAETGATSIKDMGLVMKALQPRLAGRASGDQASQVVRKLLM